MVDMERTQNEVETRIAQNVRTLLAHTGIPREEVIYALGVSRSAWYDRMNGTSRWTATDVDVLARTFGIGVGDLFSDAPKLPERRHAVVRSTPNTGWLSAHIPQPRGHIGRGLLGSWDHHYLRSVSA